MKSSDRYVKIVEWSEEDGCYVGRCPELMLGGVHGRDEKKVFAELCQVIDEWVDRAKAEHEVLPEGMAGRKYSGKFNLRLGARLHERLTLAALKEGKSLNNYVAEVLEKRLAR
jgi:predicted RNase H-like HicB family nuclease